VCVCVFHLILLLCTLVLKFKNKKCDTPRKCKPCIFYHLRKIVHTFYYYYFFLYFLWRFWSSIPWIPLSFIILACFFVFCRRKQDIHRVWTSQGWVNHDTFCGWTIPFKRAGRFRALANAIKTTEYLAKTSCSTVHIMKMYSTVFVKN